MVLQMLCGALRVLRDLDVVATGTSVHDADRLAAVEGIELLITDSRLGEESGFDLLRRLVAPHPGLRCIVITCPESAMECPADLLDWIEATIDKRDPCDGLLAAIDRVAGTVTPAARVPELQHLRERLTRREGDVFDCLGRGLTNKEIAAALGISVQTVETHRKAISKKLECNGASLVRMATLSRHLSLP